MVCVKWTLLGLHGSDTDTSDFGNGRLDANGSLFWFGKGIQASSFSTSDINAKEDIADCDLGLDFIKMLSPKSFNMKDTTYANMRMSMIQ